MKIKLAGMEGEQAVIEATASDPLVRLTEASFAVNGKKWSNVFPTDGLFDSKTETFKFKEPRAAEAGDLRGGAAHQGRMAGNTGSGDVVFAVPTTK